MTIKEMQERKKELGFTYAQIAELSGVPVGTVQKVLGGITLTPRYETIMALEQVLGESEGLMLRESSNAYMTKKQGEYTLDDYYHVIPDDMRVELIDGVIYNMTAPTSAHQIIGGFIYSRLLQHVLEKGGACLPMISPLDVQLDCDEKTMVQPDVVIVCDRDKIINRCIYGAPDFIIEVLSKSTKKKDSVIKLNKYLNAGVREYWIIDPMKQKVIVYDFEHDDYPEIFGFDAKVPVGIWDGECEIDFAEVYEHVRFLYEREKKG
ncbi:MAG: Uma2 family endonuclease [Mediterraneibacter sp.]